MFVVEHSREGSLIFAEFAAWRVRDWISLSPPCVHLQRYLARNTLNKATMDEYYCEPEMFLEVANGLLADSA